jgi:glycosyltransferase involved in cell wall biosynthesis
MSKISIAIPTYEMKGLGAQYLQELFDSIIRQTYKTVEVVVSDHSQNNEILDVCNKYSQSFSLVYVRNFYDRGNGPANTNIALQHCSGDLIKIMFADDLFTDDRALEKINERFEESDCKWVVTGFSHTTDGKNFYRPMVPRWSEHLLEGQNFMGGPSICTVRRDSLEYFDPICKMLMDTEFYHRMRYYHGMPSIIEDICVCSREGDYRISSNLELDIICEHPDGSWQANSKELEYVTEKHKETREYVE